MRSRVLLVSFAAVVTVAPTVACNSHPPIVASPSDVPGALAVQSGKATYYSDALSGRPTASGEPYEPSEYTAAHKKLPFGTVVRVVHVRTGRWVRVRINDRGPFGDSQRIIDLSKTAAKALGILREGVAPVRVEILAYGDGKRVRR